VVFTQKIQYSNYNTTKDASCHKVQTTSLLTSDSLSYKDMTTLRLGESTVPREYEKCVI